jgi:hypothetical protein
MTGVVVGLFCTLIRLLTWYPGSDTVAASNVSGILCISGRLSLEQSSSLRKMETGQTPDH